MMPLLVAPQDGEKGKWFPSPNATSSESMQQYEVLGLLMGFMATSLSNTMSLDLSKVVWKRLVHEPLTASDVTVLDKGVADQIKFLMSDECKSYDAESLSMVLPAQPMIAAVCYS